MRVPQELRMARISTGLDLLIGGTCQGQDRNGRIMASNRLEEFMSLGDLEIICDSYLENS